MHLSVPPDTNSCQIACDGGYKAPFKDYKKLAFRTGCQEAGILLFFFTSNRTSQPTPAALFGKEPRLLYLWLLRLAM